jgi:hypothetical protein
LPFRISSSFESRVFRCKGSEPIDHRRQGLDEGTVVIFAAVAPVTHQARGLQNGEVLGDHGLGDAGFIGNDVHGLLAVASQVLENRPAGGVGESFEQVVGGGLHRKTITQWLLVGQAVYAVDGSCGAISPQRA